MRTKNKESTSLDKYLSTSGILIKAALIFIVLNLLFAIAYPMGSLGKITIYNSMVPGRLRLPYGENPNLSYNISLYNLEAMFKSHEISGDTKSDNEFRVLLIGDSATWGFLLKPEETLSAALNKKGLINNADQKIIFYNLGYPVMSLTKDLLVLSNVMQYQPDLIIWLVTLESFPLDKQLFPPLIQNNPAPVRKLIEEYNLNLDENSSSFNRPSFYDKTILGARKPLADMVRFQLYGIMWAATGIDQYIPETYTPKKDDLLADPNFHNFEPPFLNENDLALDVLDAGFALSGETTILLVNEPMFISLGENSDIRYNYYYPKWAYDDYRTILQRRSDQHKWNYLDLWDTIPGEEFTNSAVHLSSTGTILLSEQLTQTILDLANQSH